MTIEAVGSKEGKSSILSPSEVTIEAAEVKRVSLLFSVHRNNAVYLIVKINLLSNEILKPNPPASSGSRHLPPISGQGW